MYKARKKMTEGKIAERWRQLSGIDGWNNLLNPIDIDLRRYIIHYGERAQAAYDTFIKEPNSKYAGASKYARKELFSRVGLENGNPFKYKVVNYIYATSQSPVPDSFILKSLSTNCWSKHSNWMGYVAVTTDEGKIALGRRDILIAWRGTIEASEWFNDLNFPSTPASVIFGEGTSIQVHRGFLSIYASDNPDSKFNKASARNQVLPMVKELIEEYKDEEISITITGHSLGASLATLNAADLSVNSINKRKSQPENHCPITVFVFGSPYVGNSHFRELFHSRKDLHVLRITNVSDYVPLLPPFLGYTHVGHELLIDTRKSQFLKNTDGFTKRHNLEAAYLHGVDGSHGVGGEFRLEVDRGIALVNKTSDMLKDEYSVPGKWWIQENKGMVQLEDGSWELQDHEPDDEQDQDENEI